MKELNWVKELNESYLQEISSAPDNMSLYMSKLKQKLISSVPNSEEHIHSFVKTHIEPMMTPLHHMRINAATTDELDTFSSHTADNHKKKFFQYVVGGGDKPQSEDSNEDSE